MRPPVLPGSSQSLLRELQAQAAHQGAALLSRVLLQARQSMRNDVQRLRGLLERDHLELSVKLLDLHAVQLCERYPKALEYAFRHHDVPDAQVGVVSAQGLRLDQLELMDDSQVQERVEMARALQHVLLIAEASLAELNTYVSALIGLAHVVAERNPVRPGAYVSALQSLMLELSLPPLVRMAWGQHICSPLGDALSASYLEWAGQLRIQGVQAVTIAVVQPSIKVKTDKRRGAVRQNREIWSPQHRERVLTLARLRKLMAGELEGAPSTPKEAFARQFEREFEASKIHSTIDTGYESTVPAAFEALQEMQQVDAVVQRMAQRPGSMLVHAEKPPINQSVREQLMAQAQNVAQALSLEVVALMVDNLVQDTRLVEPLREMIARLEPALLRLVLVDARFFIQRDHPARCLLQEISQRGLAFTSVDDPHFNAFLVSLQRFVSPLASLHIDSAEPFDLALQSLQSVWRETETQHAHADDFESVVAVLEYAEDRNLLAAKMVEDMKSIKDLQHVPPSVVDFLFGPWAQVMACAQLNDRSQADDPGGYKNLVNSLLWSVQPELTRKHIDKLTRLVPRLLSGLREGLRMIDYPSTKTSSFFDLLMKQHQLAFKPAQKSSAHSSRSGLVSTLQGSQDHWIAPAEVKASGFMAMPEEDGLEAATPQVSGGASEQFSEELAFNHLAVGAWVELLVDGTWTRTQLNWISPQKTMFLFTSAQGKTSSMTQRMLAHLQRHQLMRVLSEQSMVDGALNAVVQTAMLNSLDIRFE